MTGGYYKVDGETKNLLEKNWDFLIILNACSYDYFEDLYKNYFGGYVKKRYPQHFLTPSTSHR